MTEMITTPTGAEISLFSGAATEGVEADGFNSFGRNPRQARISQESISEASTLLTRALKGNRRAMVDVMEAFTTSDFTLSAFAVIDKELVSSYEEIQSTWQQYTSQTTVPNFRPKVLLDLLRGKVGLDRVPEVTEYPAISRKGNEVGTLRVGKFGNRYAVSWEAWLNDEAIDEIGDIPNWFSAAASETESVVAASNLVTATGINTANFNAGNGNAPDTAPLNLANLDAAIQTIRGKKDANGRPVYLPNIRLVIPPSLQTTAERILSAKEIRSTDADGNVIVSDNYMSGSVTMVVEPMLEVVSQAASSSTTWFLVPDPNSARKSLFLGKLRGHEQPELRVKADTGQRVGGGSISPEDGSFDIDDIQYRVRHVVGGGVGDMTPTYASDGTAGN